MNYRHAFHAGNFADVFKHVLLTRILLYLIRKEQPLRYIDTHAGLGRYDLVSDEAQRTGEWRGGVGLIAPDGHPPQIAELIAPWLEAVGQRGEDGRPLSYPGSPAIAQHLLRPHDRLALAELHPRDFMRLRRNMARDERVRLAEMDGYQALNAWTPPVERRGLALIDPPFEDRNEFDAIERALGKALKKWRTGVYAIWYPIKDEARIDAFYDALPTLGADKTLRLELSIGRASGPQASGLTATGLAVINPPYVLIEEARTLLPWMTERLGVSRSAGWRAEPIGQSD